MIQHLHATTNIYIHEIAVHFNHNIDDFRPPHKTSQDPNSDVLEADLIGPANIMFFTACLEGIHKTFDAFLAMNISTIRNLPVLVFVRTLYAAVVLVKMFGIVHAEGSTLATVYALELQAEHYLNATVKHLAEAAGEAEQAPIARVFRFDFEKLRAWHERRRYRIMNKNNPHQGLQPQLTPLSKPPTNTPFPSEQWSTGNQISSELGRSAAERPFTSQHGSGTFLSNPEQFDFGNFDFTFEELNAMDNLVDNAAWTSFVI